MESVRAAPSWVLLRGRRRQLDRSAAAALRSLGSSRSWKRILRLRQYSRYTYSLDGDQHPMSGFSRLTYCNSTTPFYCEATEQLSLDNRKKWTMLETECFVVRRSPFLSRS